MEKRGTMNNEMEAPGKDGSWEGRKETSKKGSWERVEPQEVEAWSLGWGEEGETMAGGTRFNQGWRADEAEEGSQGEEQAGGRERERETSKSRG